MEKRNTQQQEEIILTIVYPDGARGKSYVLTANGFREAAKDGVKNA